MQVEQVIQKTEVKNEEIKVLREIESKKQLKQQSNIEVDQEYPKQDLFRKT